MTTCFNKHASRDSGVQPQSEAMFAFMRSGSQIEPDADQGTDHNFVETADLGHLELRFWGFHFNTGSI